MATPLGHIDVLILIYYAFIAHMLHYFDDYAYLVTLRIIAADFGHCHYNIFH